MYELKNMQQIDTAANVLIRLVADRPLFVRFECYPEYECPKCRSSLDIYYCESGTYAVRCLECGLLTLVVAKNPDDALKKVGVPYDKNMEEMKK